MPGHIASWIVVTKTLLLTAALAVSAAAPSPVHDLADVDRSVRPGNDFYLFASGTWERDTPIPPDEGVARGDAAARVASVQRLAGIMAEEAAKPASRPGALYRSYMNRDGIARKGLAPARPMMAQIMALTTRDDVAEAMARYARLGVSTIFAGGPTDDDHHAGYRVLSWSSDGLGMQDRERYRPSAPGTPDLSVAYQGYLARLLTVAGVSDPDRQATAVLAFERRLAEPTPPESGEVVFDAVSEHDLEQRMPGIPWKRVIHALQWPEGRTMRIEEPVVMTARMKAFAETSVETLRAYLLARFMDAYAPYLGPDLEALAFEFDQGVLKGVTAPKPRSELGIRLVHDLVPDDIESIYAARYFPADSKRRMDELVQQVKDAFASRLARVAWMDGATRARAQVKLAHVIVEVGYPSRWHHYDGLAFSDDDLFGNVIRGKAWAWDWALAQLDQPVDRHEWTCLFPSTINACSDTARLALFLPAAYLQAPMFDPAYDAADLYGRIGATIGHELTHQFDPGGSTYDEEGLRRPWWPAAVKAAFDARTHLLASQYDAYEVAPHLHVDGRRTVSENTADLGGLNIAYDAYRQSLHGHPLPLVAGFTGDQRFFIAYAQAQRSRYSEGRLRAQLLNVHAPGHQRAFEVRNVDAWYQAFDVSPHDALYVPPGERVRIW